MKCPRAKVWKWSAKAALTAAPPIAPRIGAAWAAEFGRVHVEEALDHFVAVESG